MQNFQFYSPKSLQEALSFLSDKGSSCKIIAGGTDLIPALRLEHLHPAHVMNILEIRELRGITEQNGRLRIGSTTTFSDIVQSDLLKRDLPLLVEAASSVGGPPIRNRGTIGGNISTASPAADVLPSVIALDAELELQSQRRGIRILPAGKAVAAAYKTHFDPDEILTGILFQKLPVGSKSAFEKIARRNAMARAYLNISVVLNITDDGIVSDLRIVPGAVEAVARRVSAAEKILLGQKVEARLIEEVTEMLAAELVGVWIPEYKIPVLRNVFKRVLSRVL